MPAADDHKPDDVADQVPEEVGEEVGEEVAEEVALDGPSWWFEFTDPTEAGQRFRCDMAWLTSSYHCIFGAGCRGIELTRPDDGCCTLGAHFTDDDDVERVAAVVAQLGPDEWQFADVGAEGAWLESADPGDGGGGGESGEKGEDGDGRERKTAVVEGACILLNRVGFPAGAGCALHQHALFEGTAPHLAKPDVCWQLPIRRSYRTVTRPDESTYLEVTIAEYDRRGWGPGGHDLDWYCSRSPRAHTAAAALYRTHEAELRELMGDQGYAVLAAECERALTLGALVIHPATAAARAHDQASGRRT